ncbi:hypothetical protein QA640_45415 (plasmid) [Bradyrhizobium sp. CB82]|uniref:hypothetical protein n=1 Tax=Bradyrhizobium sp. CB82 TaxID=3039159 RepID=UPI0024B0FA4D|nr:hypothetical protein [Bradyrhizobium sp. CB82]WFU46015.1 hypothetical protein QA640_45415 [Bradyrhizobium sp. CB82]
MPSADYYLKQAELAARLALAESDPEKAQALHILALQNYDKADKATAEETPSPLDPTDPPNIIERQ